MAGVKGTNIFRDGSWVFGDDWSDVALQGVWVSGYYSCVRELGGV